MARFHHDGAADDPLLSEAGSRPLWVRAILQVTQAVTMALLPVINVVWMDWDAGMVTALVLAEILAGWLLLPLVWTAIDGRWRAEHRAEAKAVLAAAARPDATDEDRTRAQQRWVRQSAGPWNPVRSLLSNTVGAALIWLLVGLLPIILLSVSAPAWMEWASNWAVTHWGIPAMPTLALWPFALAWATRETWPLFGWSMVLVGGLVVLQGVVETLQVATGRIRARVADEESTQRLAMLTTPLFLLAGLSAAAGGALARWRELPAGWGLEDATLWSIVALLVLRGLVLTVMHTTRTWALAGTAQARRDVDRTLGATLGAAALGTACLLAAFWYLTSPHPVPQPPPDHAACVATWPGVLHPDTRAALDNWDDAWNTDPARACERLGAATSLRLRAPVHPDDLTRFTGVTLLELRGDALALAPHLDRLPALNNITLADGTLDARTLVLPRALSMLALQRLTLQHGEALWYLRDIEWLGLQDVTLTDTTPIAGRTALRQLRLERVDGERAAFLHGALGIERLRLGEQTLEPEDLKRLLWVRRVEWHQPPDEATACPILARMHRVRGEQAAACGHRWAMPD
jgi:hypothetical protein